ncbi:MAG: hypothetical protein V3V46_07270 [Anaerolineales bacterium]
MGNEIITGHIFAMDPRCCSQLTLLAERPDVSALAFLVNELDQ